MNEHARAGRMQGAGDLGADAPCAPGDQDHLAAGGESSRYRMSCAGTIPECRRSVYPCAIARLYGSDYPWSVNTH